MRQSHLTMNLTWLTGDKLVQVLVDVGAGVGYFSLAAAARSHQAIAFELSTKSVASFEASMDYNGFQKAITIHKARSYFALHDTMER